MRKLKPILSFLCIFLYLSAFSQNSVPVISNITALTDTVSHILTVKYDVADAENDNMEIYLQMSADSGFTYPFNGSNATGDIGFPVTQGTGKKIRWNYPDSLNALLPLFCIKLTADDHVAIDI